MSAQNILFTSREQVAVNKFSVPTLIIAPMLAILFQTYVAGRWTRLNVIDLPLLVTIFFSVARRSPVIGMAQGCAIGLVQDAFTNLPIGVYGIAKTIIGFAASSLGGRIDVENPGSRIIMTFVFYLLHQGVYVMIARGMLGLSLTLNPTRLLLAAALNGGLAVVLFSGMDRLKQKS